MGLLDYYRQFEDVDEREVNRELRERRRRERARALEQVPVLDLSTLEWPDMPNPEVMNASIFAARGCVNGYPDRYATAVRRALAERHGVDPEQIAVGNGAVELLQTAALVLLGPGDELVTPWPSYPLYPIMASRAGAQPVPVPLAADGFDAAAVRKAVGDDTRVVTICNPNDPTGAYLPADDLGELISMLPERVWVLLDEAYIQFQDVEEEDAGLRLVEAFPRLLVFRTFSKIYGLSGLRAGYVVASRTSASMLESLTPVLGVNALTQAALMHALKIGDRDLAVRRRTVIESRRRLIDALHDLPVDAPPSQANLLWLRAAGLSGAELAARLERASVLVAPGAPLGDDEHVRAAIRGPAATARLLGALEQAFR